jgi:hypothetical protein
MNYLKRIKTELMGVIIVRREPSADGSRSLNYLFYLDALSLNACAECTPVILCWVATWHPHLQDIKII